MIPNLYLFLVGVAVVWFLPGEQKIMGFLLWAMMLGIYSKLDDVKK